MWMQPEFTGNLWAFLGLIATTVVLGIIFSRRQR